MKKIALIYSFNSNKTRLAADKIAAEFSENEITKVNAETLTGKEFISFDNYILGVPTWFDGELPNYWDEFVPELEDLDLKGKTFAIFGLGDQVGYPENFVDGIGIMAGILEKCGGKIVGETSTEGYTFESSSAFRNGKFLGLVLDQENQARLTRSRIKNWVSELKQNFK
ncbi:MAG: flavodoxin [Prolixibacteraceae bacterium]|nr:flavodoxin [Prolixibacteraceae bacterium]MBN2773301.1 flavodoxin [Prolixibacteraceae bacterium]